MTAVGLAGPLNLGQLLSVQSSYANRPVSRDKQVPPAIGPGGVKTCVENRDSGGLVNATEYKFDGESVSSGMEIDGTLHHSSSDRQESEERDSQGRLLKHLFGWRGELAQETVYSCDNEGRLLPWTQPGITRLEFHYQSDGSKISAQTFDPSHIERTNGIQSRGLTA